VILAVTLSFWILDCTSQTVIFISSAREVQFIPPCLLRLTQNTNTVCNLLSAWVIFLVLAIIYAFLLLTQIL